MIVMPAIDLKDGRCVRLRQGLAEDVTVYSDKPADMARHWESLGARFLHVVDLDGAFQGHPVHTAIIREIAAAISIPIEVGGGLRTPDDIDALLACGVSRAILGTRALTEPDAVAEMVARFGRALAVGIDARDGFVQVKGWVETTAVNAIDLARNMDAAGVATIIYTDTATDGMMKGTNIGAMNDMAAAVACNIVASGGISSVADLRNLIALNRPNLSGAIVGKALYEGSVTFAELAAAAGR